MPRRSQNLNSLARGRVRASMNKYNLFNMYKKPQIRYTGKTLFQQKWLAKQETRAYHGEHLTERRWKQVFNPNLESVAQLDASLKGMKVSETPLPLQTYAALEKRLETAVFRALFASSVRQAREFILGGYVLVNGVVIKHPAFPLRPGDVFNVKPEKVLLAMGRVKPSLEKAIKVDNKQIAVWNKYVKTAKQSPRDVWELKQAKPKSLNTIDGAAERKLSVKHYNDFIEKEMLEKQKNTTRESLLARILAHANGTETSSPELYEELFGKNNAERCHFIYTKLYDAKHDLVTKHSAEQIAKFISTKSTEFESEAAAKVAAHVKKALNELVSYQLKYLLAESQGNKLPENTTNVPFTPEFTKNLRGHPKLDKDAILEDELVAKVHLPWQKGLFGRQDPSKPYFTPWTPRPFLGAFAILPSHIEVSFSTCHAVYMRDPVARPGYSEVISPFPTHVHERAYMYYARKGL